MSVKTSIINNTLRQLGGKISEPQRSEVIIAFSRALDYYIDEATVDVDIEDELMMMNPSEKEFEKYIKNKAIHKLAQAIFDNALYQLDKQRKDFKTVYKYKVSIAIDRGF